MNQRTKVLATVQRAIIVYINTPQCQVIDCRFACQHRSHEIIAKFFWQVFRLFSKRQMTLLTSSDGALLRYPSVAAPTKTKNPGYYCG